MISQDRLAVFATRSSYTLVKARLANAQKGHALLKHKADALLLRFRVILARMLEAKSQLHELMRKAEFTLAEVRFQTGNINAFVLEHVNQAQYRLTSHIDHMAGVSLYVYDVYELRDYDDYALTGLAFGRQKVLEAKMNYQNVIRMLVDLASLQTCFVTLDGAITSANRRVNSMNYILIPRIERTIKYIASELDEAEREEFYRLKKLQKRKRLTYMQAAEKRKARNCRRLAAGDGAEQKIARNLLEECQQADEDVLF